MAHVVSGDGYERNMNGASGPQTSWAQPSGLALDSAAGKLYVADSESSSVSAEPIVLKPQQPITHPK